MKKIEFSPAIQLLSIVWREGAKDSWARVNKSMRDALLLAIGSGLSFTPQDFQYLQLNYRWGFWVGDIEWIYSEAIVNGNTSCVEAFEAWMERKPFRANEVEIGYTRNNYLHSKSSRQQRERLAVGFSFPYDGARWFVTKFEDNRGVLRAARYADNQQTGKPKKLKVFTHEEITELFPSPSTLKKRNEAR